MKNEKHLRPAIRRDVNTLSHNYSIVVDHSKHGDEDSMFIIKVANHCPIFAVSFQSKKILQN